MGSICCVAISSKIHFYVGGKLGKVQDVLKIGKLVNPKGKLVRLRE